MASKKPLWIGADIDFPFNMLQSTSVVGAGCNVSHLFGKDIVCKSR